MSHLGYSFESEVELFFLELTGKKRSDPIISPSGQFNRSFRVPGSGAMACIKGDIIGILPWVSRFFKVECKCRYEVMKRTGQIICIQKEWFDKNTAEALKDNQIPILVIAFKGSKAGRIWFIIEKVFFEELKDVFNFIPGFVHINGCVGIGKKARNPYMWIYKNKLLASVNPKTSGHAGYFKIWEREYYIIPRELFHHMLRKIPEIKEGKNEAVI